MPMYIHIIVFTYHTYIYNKYLSERLLPYASLTLYFLFSVSYLKVCRNSILISKKTWGKTVG